MIDQRRQQYLQVMGIQAWRLRDAAPAADVVAEASEPQMQAAEVDASSVSPDWQALKNQVAACTACVELAGTRTQTVFGIGNPQADWLVIGEAPGAEEDRQGEPFVGPAGQLLNAMLKALGLSRETVYIANMLKCRPPRNRDPRPEEVLNCRPFLQHQVELIQPKLILCVGHIAAQNLLDTTESLDRLRGQVHRLNDIPVVVTYHPAHLLRTPIDKRKAWVDLQYARHIIQVGIP